MQHPISLPAPPGEYEEGERVTIRVSSRRPVRAKIVDEAPPGFAVDRATIDDALTRADAGVCIAASRHGEELTVDRLDGLVERTTDDGMTVVFGAPERGLPEILDCEPGEGTRDDEPTARFDLWLNTVPNQGSEVVRTEEALFASLAPLTLE
jgi:hypothetical protein